MHLSYVFICFFSHAAVALAAALQPRASPPLCTYICPIEVTGRPAHTSSTTYLNCFYSFGICIYNVRDGSLAWRTVYKPGHTCPSQADVYNCSSTRKREANEAKEAERKRRVAARAKLPAEVENMLKSRAYLGKQKRNNKKA